MQGHIWKKRVLIPFWVIQILICLVFILAAALGLYVVDNVNADAAVEAALNTGAAVDLTFALLTILFDVAEMIMMCMHRLHPVTFIVFQCIKSAIWTAFLLLTIYAAAVSSTTGLTIFLVVVLFLTCMGQLIYGATIVHRHRKGTLYRGNYSLAQGGGQTAYTGAAPAPAPYAPQTGTYAVPHPDPFRNPSQTSFGGPSPYQSTAQQPGVPPFPQGDYYHPQSGQQSYEMHGTSQRYH
ncbi:uncharacterized protein LTR77_002263 [Saxophila tyrrhenica]|uniref:Uncharacterized protein n=1 Tax=Saxophila tyrrhenica TaxID=1690608 RepID=A0AAV9PIF1_9PEZI|nr:hypothetical protein LTR77_002263 [Saxophila tyrrhenica]